MFLLCVLCFLAFLNTLQWYGMKKKVSSIGPLKDLSYLLHNHIYTIEQRVVTLIRESASFCSYQQWCEDSWLVKVQGRNDQRMLSHKWDMYNIRSMAQGRSQKGVGRKNKRNEGEQWIPSSRNDLADTRSAAAKVTYTRSLQDRACQHRVIEARRTHGAQHLWRTCA